MNLFLDCRFGLNQLPRQNDDGSFETELAKVSVEGESMIESMAVDQSKAGAIDKAKVFVIVPYKDYFGALLN